MNAPFDEFGPSFAASLNGRPRKGRGEARPYQANRRLPQKPKLDPTKVSYADKPAAGWSGTAKKLRNLLTSVGVSPKA